MEYNKFMDVVEACRQSYYHDLADALEHYADHDINRYGPIYKPLNMPHRHRIDAYHVLWAFKAGRAFEREQLD